MTERWFSGSVGAKVVVAKDAHRPFRGDVGLVDKDVGSHLYVNLDRNGRQCLSRETLLPYDPSYVVTDEDRLGCRHDKARLQTFVGSDLSRRLTEDFNRKHPRANATSILEFPQDPKEWPRPIETSDVFRHCICGAMWTEGVDYSFGGGYGIGFMWDITALVVKRGAPCQEPWQLNDSTCYGSTAAKAEAYFRRFWGDEFHYEIVSLLKTEQWKLNLPEAKQ